MLTQFLDQANRQSEWFWMIFFKLMMSSSVAVNLFYEFAMESTHYGWLFG